MKRLIGNAQPLPLPNYNQGARLIPSPVAFPDDLLQSTNMTLAELTTELAVALFRKDRLTPGQAASLSGLSQPEFRLLLKSSLIPEGASVYQNGEPVPEATTPLQASAEHQEERRWLDENRSACAGQWVALSQKRLLAAGPIAVDVYRAVRNLGAVSPFVVWVDTPSAQPFAGW